MTPGRVPLILNSDRAPFSEAGEGLVPRRDYLLLAETLSAAPILYAPASARGPIGLIEKKTASDIRQAFAAFARRRQVSGYVSLSEKAAIPLALLLGRRSRVPHVMVAHHVTSDKKRALQKRTGYLHRFARIAVICRSQEHYLIEEAGVPAERVACLDYRVDEIFWTRGNVADSERALPQAESPILAVGRERRDYVTLARAAHSLPSHKFIIVASSPWSRGEGETPIGVPANIEVRQNMTWMELRRVYGMAAAVVVPLAGGTLYGAGLTGILEAMAMGKPLIVTGTPGIEGYVEDGVNARLVAPGDSARMAAAITDVVGNQVLARRLGNAARASVVGERGLESYISGLAKIVRGAMANHG